MTLINTVIVKYAAKNVVINIKEFENFIVDKNLSLVFIITFFSAYFTISVFIKVINKIGFTPFVIY